MIEALYSYNAPKNLNQIINQSNNYKGSTLSCSANVNRQRPLPEMKTQKVAVFHFLKCRLSLGLQCEANK